VVTVTHLSKASDEGAVLRALARFGATHVRIVRNHPSGEAVGKAHVHFTSREAAAEAVDALAAAAADLAAGRDASASGVLVDGRAPVPHFNPQMESQLTDIAMSQQTAAAATAGHASSGHACSGAWGQAPTEAGGAGSQSLAFDPATGLHYDAATGYYLDSSRGLYYHASTQVWSYWDSATSTLKPYPSSNGLALEGSGSAGAAGDTSGGPRPGAAAGGALGVEALIHHAMFEAAAATAPVRPAAGAAPAAAPPAPASVHGTSASAAPAAERPGSAAPAPVQLGSSTGAPLKLALSAHHRKTPLARLKPATRVPAATFARPGDDEDAPDRGAAAAVGSSSSAPPPPPPAPPAAALQPAAASEDGPYVPPEHLALGDFDRLLCTLCGRRVASAHVLRRHLAESTLHKQNYEKALADRAKNAEAAARASKMDEYKQHLEAVRAQSVGKETGNTHGVDRKTPRGTTN